MLDFEFDMILVVMKCARFFKTCQSSYWPRKWHRKLPVVVAVVIPTHLRRRVEAAAVIAIPIAVRHHRRRLLVRLARDPEAGDAAIGGLAPARDPSLLAVIEANVKSVYRIQ